MDKQPGKNTKYKVMRGLNHGNTFYCGYDQGDDLEEATKLDTGEVVYEILGFCDHSWQAREYLDTIGSTTKAIHQTVKNMPDELKPNGNGEMEALMQKLSGIHPKQADSDRMAAACETICTLCKRLNPQHADCTSCDEIEYYREGIIG